MTDGDIEGMLTWSHVREWLARYGVAECGGITCALLGSVLVRHVTGNAVAAAYGAAWGESLGYSSVIITRDFLAERRVAHSEHHGFGLKSTGRVVSGLVAEFGPAGVLDTLVTRPLAMGAGVRFFGPRLGIIAGKLVADLLFYIPVVFMYERKKRWRRGASAGGDA